MTAGISILSLSALSEEEPLSSSTGEKHCPAVRAIQSKEVYLHKLPFFISIFQFFSANRLTRRDVFKIKLLKSI